MGDKLQGAYVQAWVWVDLGGDEDESVADDTITDDTIRNLARDIWHEDGTIELDHDAKVSRSYEGG